MLEEEWRDRCVEAILENVRQAGYLYAPVFNREWKDAMFVGTEGSRDSLLPPALTSILTAAIPGNEA